MRYRRATISILFAFIILCFSSKAQISISSISVKVGRISTFEQIDRDYTSTFIPEIQVGGIFFTKYFNWGAYWSYWNDGIDKVIGIDYVTYSHSSHILGYRMSFSPMYAVDNWYIPIDVFAGVAEHFIKARYIGGSDLTGRFGSNYSKTTTTFELGVSLPIHIIGSWNILAEAQQYFPIGNNDLVQMQRGQESIKIGANYSF